MLDELYTARAIPPGSPRYWSWLFTPQHARDALLGVFALQAEWRALTDADTDPGVAATKLAWWRDEIRRLVDGQPVHPISRWLRALPGATDIDFRPLGAAVEAAYAMIAGAPIESGYALEAFADDWQGRALRLAASWAQGPDDARDSPRLATSTRELASGAYLSRASADYRRDARVGRILLPVDELLQAGIDNDDLIADDPPARLCEYLALLRTRAALHFQRARAGLPGGLAVLAELGERHLASGRAPRADEVRLTDLWWAWRAARRQAVQARNRG